MPDWTADAAARWIAEAVETGNPLAPLPAGLAPRDAGEGWDIAVAALEQLEIAPCGLRLLYRQGAEPLVGPMIEGRMVPAGAPVALEALRHPVLTAAVLGVLAERLDPGSTGLPRFASLHAALDFSATRYGEATADGLALTADLARLGLVVVGRGKPIQPPTVPASLGAKGGPRKSQVCDLGGAFLKAAQAARELGGLPAGGVLVVAGLTPPAPAVGTVSASLGQLGRVEATCA
jgi:hypothetical protein